LSTDVANRNKPTSLTTDQLTTDHCVANRNSCRHGIALLNQPHTIGICWHGARG